MIIIVIIMIIIMMIMMIIIIIIIIIIMIIMIIMIIIIEDLLELQWSTHSFKRGIHLGSGTQVWESLSYKMISHWKI